MENITIRRASPLPVRVTVEIALIFRLVSDLDPTSLESRQGSLGQLNHTREILSSPPE
jgi:hypothetical protein